MQQEPADFGLIAEKGGNRLDVYSVNTLLCQPGEGRVNFTGLPHRRWNKHQFAPACHLLRLFVAGRGNRVVRVEHHSYAGGRRQRVLEKLDALAGQSAGALHHRHAGDVATRPRQAGDEARAHRIARQ